ncbi:MAG: hypothetical protein JW699_06580 [Chitinispirillaceae bacterium]|nr:hypothetical protein [Chitinispirillaceae bacterium]
MGRADEVNFSFVIETPDGTTPRLQAGGIPPGLVPLPLMFDWYEANRELAGLTWPAEMLIKKMLEIAAAPRAKGRPA